MRNYIQAAEAALTAVGFPEEAIGEAKAEFAFTAASEADYMASHMYFDEKFVALAKAEEEKLKEKALENGEFENALDEKTLEEIGDILDQRAAYEDQMMEKIIEREEKQKLAEKNRDAQIIASFKKPTNRVEVKRAFSDRNMAQLITKQFVALMEKATNTTADKEAKANSAFRSLGMLINEVWTNQNNMHTNAIKFFKATYNTIKNDTPGMSVAERIVAAQKMADIMLNTYSPAAADPSLAQYGENYAVQKMYNDEIKALTGFEGDVNDLMSSVKVELGIEKEKVNFGNEFGEAANDKSAKVEEHKAPVAENVKQS